MNPASNQADSVTPLAPPTLAVASRRRFPWVPLALALLALLDLRVELQLLGDHITLTSISEAVGNHLLAVVVLFLMPSLLRRYRS